jgi:hypothetical protein
MDRLLRNRVRHYVDRDALRRGCVPDGYVLALTESVVGGLMGRSATVGGEVREALHLDLFRGGFQQALICPVY